jgi:hypothetical protein
MKYLLATLLLSVNCYAGTALFTVRTSASVPITNATCYLLPGGASTNDNALNTADRLEYITDTNGKFYASNVVQGAYALQVRGPFTVTTRYYEFPETNGVFRAEDFGVSSNSTPGSTTGYTKTQADARYWSKDGLRAGNNLTYRTNAGRVYIDAQEATSPTNGVTATTATNIAVSIASDTNTALLTSINTASNAAYTAAAGVASGLDAARRAEIYTASNAVISTLRSDAREWNVKQFGAKGDGVLVNQTATIAGSKYVTFNAAAFTPNDIGKTISIVEAGADGLNLTTTIESVSGPTAITIADAAYSAVLDRTSVYGTDDTLPIQAGMDTTGTNGGGTLYFPAGIYMVAGALRDVGAGLHHNAQLWFPELPPVGQTSTRIKLAGPISPSLRQFAVVPSQRWGIVPGAAVLWSTLVTTNGRMMHCANYTASSYTSPTDSTVKFNAVTVEIRNLHFRVVPNPGLTALDLTGAVTSHIENVVVDTGWQEYAGPQPTNTTSRGIWMPHTSNAGGGSMVTRNTIIGGFYTGIQFQEHSLIENVTTYGCWYGYYPAFGGHSMKMVNCNAEGCKYQMISRDYASIIDAELSIENSLAGWWAPGYLLDDNGALGGELRYHYQYQTAALPLTNTVNAATPGRFLDIIQWRPYMKPRYPLVQATNLTGTIDIARLPAIPISGVTGLPAALAWLTNNIGGGSTGAVSSVNGLTGAVTLDAADVGAEPALGFAPQPATANGTNWASISTNIIADLRQEIADTTLDFIPQVGSANLTNLSAYSANSFLTWTNWNPGDPSDYDIVRMQPIIAGSVVAGGWIDFWETTEEWHVGQIVHAPEFIGSVSAANLTGTIDAARLPPATTNAILGGINLSNPAANAIYMLSITTNTTLGNFGNMHASEFRTAQLWVQNTAGSNCTVALPDGTRCPDGTTLYCTNGGVRVISIGGLLNFTNAISRALP